MDVQGNSHTKCGTAAGAPRPGPDRSRRGRFRRKR